jgi:hypothetical protein
MMLKYLKEKMQKQSTARKHTISSGMTNQTKILLAITLIAVAVLGRLIPHTWNFTPIVGVAMFAGAYLGKKYAFTVPLIAMFVSDIFIGFYDWKMMLVVYLSFALSGTIGIWVGKRKFSTSRLLLSSIGASTLFYIVTNTAVWAFGTMYSSGLEGLATSLVAGIPFFRNMLVGDVWFSFVLFGTYELAVLIHNKVINSNKNTSKAGL